MGKEGSNNPEESYATRKMREKEARRKLLEGLMGDSDNPIEELKSIHQKYKKKPNRPAA